MAQRKPIPRKSPMAVRRPPASAPSVEMALAVFAHEIRTPLTGIIALAELLGTSELGDRERRWVASLKSAAEHLAGLTTLAVDSARADAAGLVLRRDAVDVREFVNRLADMLTARAQAKGLACSVAVAADVPGAVIGDALRLRAALENLIDNAVKFTEAGEVGLDVAVAPAARGRSRLVFTIRDAGIGMTPAELKRLFRPFAQANLDIARTHGGAGLGLAMVKRLAAAMGGKLTVKSRPGHGSIFQLTVAVEPAPAAAAAPNGRSRAASRPLDILCVEDNPYGRVILKTILSELGHRPDFVGSGEAALGAVGRGFDAILMDITLPGIDGIEVARRIRALGGPVGAVPLIGLSGHDAAAQEASARAAGMDAYLVKPVSPSALEDMLQSLSKRA